MPKVVRQHFQRAPLVTAHVTGAEAQVGGYLPLKRLFDKAKIEDVVLAPCVGLERHGSVRFARFNRRQQDAPQGRGRVILLADPKQLEQRACPQRGRVV